MRKTRKRKWALIGAIILSVSMCGCNGTGAATVTPDTGKAAEVEATTAAYAVESVAAAEKMEVKYEDEDQNSSWKESSYTKITGSAKSVVVDGNGVKEDSGIITITAAGTYMFTGTFPENQIVVDAGKNDVVWIVLNNTNMVCKDSAVINGVQSEKIILTLEEGTKNQMEDGSTHKNLDSSNEPDGAVFSKDDLVINGTGNLTVKGNYGNGIVSKDDLTIISGSIDVTAVNDGIKGKDSVVVRDGSLSVQSKGDGIQSSNDTDSTKGYIILEGGTVYIDSEQDGIQAESLLQISGGVYEIVTGDGSASADAKANNTQPGDMQERGKQGIDTLESETVSDTTSDSVKALKGGSAVYIMDGTFQIDSFEDAVHSNGNVTISGGKINLSAGDDGIHADAALLISGGTIEIAKSYEGLEGATVTITEGSTHLTATDDGVNASGSTETTKTVGKPSENNTDNDAGVYVRIAGGYLYVDAGGDGLDSNGALYFEGGTTIVNGPTDGGNGALDYDGMTKITGGILIAAGSSQMAQTLGDTSTQTSLFVSYKTKQAAGELINLLDANGNTVFRFAPSKEYSSIVISTPTLVSGETYTLTSGGTVTGGNTSPVDGYYTDGNNTTGTKLTNVTLTDMVTQIAEDGTAVTTEGMGGGGMGGKGGMDGTRPERN